MVIAVMLVVDAFRKGGPPWPILIFIAILFLLLGLIVFGKYVYPLLSPSIGGGKSPIIRLIVDEDNENLISSSIGVPVEDSLSEPVQLLAKTSDYFLIIAIIKNSNFIFVLSNKLIVFASIVKYKIIIIIARLNVRLKMIGSFTVFCFSLGLSTKVLF